MTRSPVCTSWARPSASRTSAPCRPSPHLGLADAVEFTGSVTDEELIAYYQGCDAFVCLSSHEGFCYRSSKPCPTIYRSSPGSAPRPRRPYEGRHGPSRQEAGPRSGAAIDRVVRDDRLRQALSDGATERLASYSLHQTSDVFIRAVEAGGRDAANPNRPRTGATSGRFELCRSCTHRDGDRRAPSPGVGGPVDLPRHDLETMFLVFGPEGPRRNVRMHQPLTVATALRLLFPTTPPDELTALAARWEARRRCGARRTSGSCSAPWTTTGLRHRSRCTSAARTSSSSRDWITLALDRHDLPSVDRSSMGSAMTHGLPMSPPTTVGRG